MLLFPFYRQRNWDSKGSSHLPKVMRLTDAWPGMYTSVFRLQSPPLSPNSAGAQGPGLRGLSLPDSLTHREGTASHSGDAKSSLPSSQNMPRETFQPDPSERHQASSGFPKVKVSMPHSWGAPKQPLKSTRDLHWRKQKR